VGKSGSLWALRGTMEGTPRTGAASGRIQRQALEDRVWKALLQRDHVSDLVAATVKEGRGQASLRWHVGADRRAGRRCGTPARQVGTARGAG
jgi:hypothetical protein